jgi:uncharacterized protein (TIGR03067 family)
MKPLFIVAIALAAASLNAQDGDLKKLQGTWNIVSLELNGETMPVSAMGNARFVIQGDHFTAQGMGATYEGTLEVDASATPKNINMNFTAGPEKGNKSLGIYELDGDNLRICLTTRGDVRPKSFAAPPGTGFALEVWKRKRVDHDLGFDDTPMLPGLPYHVHDYDRPHPRVVTPSSNPTGPPSDAIVLFDGKDLSKWMAHASSITRAGGSGDAEWKVVDGYMEVVPKTGDIATRDKFGDCQLHVEWSEPPDIGGKSQGRGNSGVLLMGRYEIQVLDAYNNPTYADGMAGAIYGQWPPLANPSRKPGEWQVYDIVFEAPKFEGEKLVKPAYFTVFWNGVLVHNRQAAMGPMVYRQVAHYVPQPAEDSLVLQNHNNNVRFRNIWIRRLGHYDEPPR